jgi:hypothetical protein
MTSSILICDSEKRKYNTTVGKWNGGGGSISEGRIGFSGPSSYEAVDTEEVVCTFIGSTEAFFAHYNAGKREKLLPLFRPALFAD